MEALLLRHTSRLLQKGDPLQAVEVYRLAAKATDAALLLAKLAEDAGAGKMKRRLQFDSQQGPATRVLEKYFPFLLKSSIGLEHSAIAGRIMGVSRQAQGSSLVTIDLSKSNHQMVECTWMNSNVESY